MNNLSSLSHRIYSRLLRKYQRDGQSGRRTLFMPVFERTITFGASALMRWHRFEFPERKTGGWWWISRFRFEFLAGWFEEESMIWCRRLIEPGMTVIDVGAHLGFYSRRLSKLVGSQGRVLAFEANPENFEVLQRNLRGYKNVEAFNNCVADHDGTFTLHVSPGHSNHSLLAGYTESATEIELRGVALDSFLASRGIREVGFIKSDTEGAEPLVVAGMRQLLSSAPKPNLLLEYNPRAVRFGGTQPEELVKHLEEFGYEVRAIAPDGSLGGIPELTGFEYCNILCRPAEDSFAFAADG